MGGFAWDLLMCGLMVASWVLGLYALYGLALLAGRVCDAAKRRRRLRARRRIYGTLVLPKTG